MTRTRIYITFSIILTCIVVGLFGWSIYIGKQQQSLTKNSTNAFINTGGNTTFGGVLGGIADTVTNAFTPTQEAPTPVFQPVLQQLYNLPTAGFTVLGTSTIRFTDRASGHVFEKDVFGQTATRIDQTTTPRVYESLFTQDATHIIRRVITDDGTLLSAYSIIGGKKDASLFLPAHISSIVVSPDSQQIAYVLLTQEGSSIVVSNPNGSQKNELFRSTLRGWRIQWSGDTIVVTQKSSHGLSNTAFTLSVPQGTITPLIARESFFDTNTSPDGTETLISSPQESGPPTLVLLNNNTKERTELYVPGFTDKCVWSSDSIHIYCGLSTAIPDAQYPDAWYQGTVQFSDSLWSINTQEGTLTQIAPISEQGGVALDMIDLQLSADESVLLFKNKTDQTLWSITLTEPVKELSPDVPETAL